jgi:hypothetical protein
MLGGMGHAVDVDDSGAGQPAGAAQQVDARVCEPALLAGVGVVRDHEVAPGERSLDVHLGGCRRVARRLNRLAGTQQGLRRDAGEVGALSSHELALHQSHAQASLCQSASAVLAGRASADNDHVVVRGGGA